MRIIFLLFISLLPFPIRRYIYIMMGYKISSNCHFGLFSIIDVKKSANFAEGSYIGPFTYIKADEFYMGKYSKISPFSFIIVPKVNIGNDTKISNFVIIRSGHLTNNSQLFLGDLVHISPFVMIDTSRKVYIDGDAGIGPHCNIFTHGSYKSILQGYPVTYGDVSIGKRVELTYNVMWLLAL